MNTQLIHKLKLAGVTLSALACTAAFGADRLFDFDTVNPTNASQGFIVVGSHTPFAWSSGLPDAGGYSYGTNGNPVTGGYLSIGDGDKTGQQLVIVFPDVDGGYPIKAFHLTADVRAGNSSTARPADGFSISYCREGDVVLVNATNGIAGGAAGGDDAATTLSPNGSGDLENGTKSGVAIIFDAWQGNMLPDTGPGGTPGPDVEGIEIRVDDKTLFQSDMSGDRNGACADCGSEQTGPNAGDGGAPDGAGTLALCWAPLDVELTTNKQVTVKWKNCTLLDHFQLSNYANHRGRLVLMGRTGGSDQNDHFDNIHLVTTPAVEATLDNVRFGPNLNQFQATISDNGISVVTNVSQVTLDGVDVTSQTTFTHVNGKTTVIYTQGPFFTANTTHPVSLTWQTSIGQTLSANNMSFTVTPYLILPASMAVPDASVNTANPGFLINPIQTSTGNPGRNYWTDEQLEGLHGTNWIDFSTVFNYTPGVGIAWNYPIDFNYANGSAGQFPLDYGFDSFGVPAAPLTSADNSSFTATAYLHFPTAGLYNLGVNSDDGFRVSFFNNSKDMLGAFVPIGFSFDGGRGIGVNQNVGAVYVNSPGYYGVRVMYYNGGGGAGMEFYSKLTPTGGLVDVLVNDSSNPNSILAFQSSTAGPAYVSFAEPPLEDNAVYPVADLHYQITDDGTTVNPGDVTLTINGVATNPVKTKNGNVTDVLLTHPASGWSGSNWVNLSYQGLSHAYYFIVAPYTLLPTNTWSAPGSGSNPGFAMRSFQSPNTNIVNGWQNTTAFAINGGETLFSANIADLSGATHNGMFWNSGVINYSHNGAGTLTDNGDFRQPAFPDALPPGLPHGPGGGTGAAGDNEAWVAHAFLEFSAPGFYLMGVNSDDGFVVFNGDKVGPGHTAASILAPASLANSSVLAIDQSQNFGAKPPSPPIVARAVLSDPPWPGAMPNNASALAGNIAIIHRDPSGGVQNHSHWAQQAGAVAVIVVDQDNDGATPPVPVGPTRDPGLWGAGSLAVSIPVVMIDYTTGTNVIAHATTNSSSPVVMSVGYSHPIVGEFSGGRGSTDTTFGILVPQAGLYPFTLYWENGGGDSNCEWFMQDTTTGNKTLINDPAGTAKAWIQRTTPTAAVLNKPSVSGNSVTLSWSGSGELEFALSPSGPWFTSGNQSNPQTITADPSIGSMFYRIRSF